MKESEAIVGIVFEPHELRRYRALETPVTIRMQGRRIIELDRHLAELRGSGDDDALRGVVICMQCAVLALVAIPARNIADLETKQRILVAQREHARPNADVEEQIATALLPNYNLLELGPAQVGRLKRMLDPLYANDAHQVGDVGVH